MSTPSVPSVLSLVTLGVSDVAASTAFYEALGLELYSTPVPGEVSFFRTAGGLLGFYGADDLRRDALAGPPAPAGAFRGVTLAVNVADPDGHLWEVAHNPFWPLGSDGVPQLP